MNAAVVIATYNERENLGGLVSAVLQHAGFRIIVVDDDSPDGTGALADALATQFPGRVSVIHRTGARGLGRSLVTGLQRALEGQQGRALRRRPAAVHPRRHLAPRLPAAHPRAENARTAHLTGWPRHGRPRPLGP